jgi:hypothetical protein
VKGGRPTRCDQAPPNPGSNPSPETRIW